MASRRFGDAISGNVLTISQGRDLWSSLSKDLGKMAPNDPKPSTSTPKLRNRSFFSSLPSPPKTPKRSVLGCLRSHPRSWSNASKRFKNMMQLEDEDPSIIEDVDTNLAEFLSQEPNITSFDSPVKEKRMSRTLERSSSSKKRSSTRWKSLNVYEVEDPSIIEDVETNLDLHQYEIHDRNPNITASDSPIKLDLLATSFKNDTHLLIEKPSNTRRRKPCARDIMTPATPNSCRTSTQKSSSFVGLVQEQLKRIESDTDKQRRIFVHSEKKDFKKQLKIQVTSIVTDSVISIINGEVVDTFGYDEDSEFELICKSTRMIFPKKWSDELGLSRLSHLMITEPFHVTKTQDERIFIDSIFWLEVVDRQDQATVREPQERPIHEWDCSCQVSRRRIVPECDQKECQERFEKNRNSKYPLTQYSQFPIQKEVQLNE